MALSPITPSDIKYRLNKLKCCFATKAAEISDKLQRGHACEDEMCNLKLLGAYIEMIECYSPLPCDCYDEWVSDGKQYWDSTTASTTGYAYGTVVKMFPRSNANPGEYLYLRWQGTLNTNAIPGWAQQCGGLPPTMYVRPCFEGLYGNVPGAWSVCGHVKTAWEARGYLEWNENITYGDGDIVKFMGGGPGAVQKGKGKYYISIVPANSVGSGFHESGHWVELECWDEPA